MGVAFLRLLGGFLELLFRSLPRLRLRGAARFLGELTGLLRRLRELLRGVFLAVGAGLALLTGLSFLARLTFLARLRAGLRLA